MASTHELVQTTSCPFSRKADVVHASAPELHAQSKAELFTDTYDRLVQYVEDEYTPESDGIFIELPKDRFGDSFSTTVAAFRKMIEEFGVKEIGDAEEYLYGVETDKWQLKVADVRFFVILFSPIYSEDHPRHSPDPEKVQLFFQPVLSFDNHIKATYGTKQNAAMKRAIRNAFAESGRPYDDEVAGSTIETEKYLKPLRIGETAVRWWDNQYNTGEFENV